MAKKPPPMASAPKPKSAKAIGKQPAFMAGKAKPFGGGDAAARRARLAGKKL